MEKLYYPGVLPYPTQLIVRDFFRVGYGVGVRVYCDRAATRLFCCGNEPPMVNADRIVCVDEFRDGQGCLLDKIPAEETASFMESIRGCELLSLIHI